MSFFPLYVHLMKHKLSVKNEGGGTVHTIITLFSYHFWYEYKPYKNANNIYGG